MKMHFLLLVLVLWNLESLHGQTGKSAMVPNHVSPRDAITLKGHDEEVTCLVFHPLGSLLTSGGHEGAFITWNIAEFCKHKQNTTITPLERKSNSDHIASIDYDGSGRLFACSGVTHWGNGFGSKLAIFTPIQTTPFGMGCDCAFSWSCVAIHRQGRFLVTGSLNRQFKAVSLLPQKGRTGKVTLPLASKSAVIVPDAVWRTHCHPFQSLAVAGGKGGWIRIYSIGMGGIDDAKAQVEGHSTGVTGLKFTPDGENLVSVGQDKLLKVWSLETGKELKSITTINSDPKWCDLHPVYPWVVIAFEDGRGQIFDYETGKEIASFKGHTQAMNSAVFHPEGHWVATAGDDHVIKFWDLGISPIPINKRPRPQGK